MAKLSKQTKQTIILCSVLLIAVAIAVATIVIVSHKKQEKLEERGKLVYKPLAEVLADAPNALGKTYENLTLPESISLSAPEKLYTMHEDLLQTGITKEQLQQKCIDVVKILNNKDIKADDLILDMSEYDEGDYFNYTYYTNENSNPNDHNVRIYHSGGCLIWNPSMVQNEVGEIVFEPHITKTYAIDDPQLESLSCDLAGTDYTAKQAVEYSQKTLDKILPLCTEYGGVVPTLVCVLDNEYNDHQSFLVRFVMLSDGVEFDSTGTSNHGGSFMRETCIEVVITRPDAFAQIKGVITNQGIQKTKLKDKFVTLDSALEHATVEFAPYFKNAVTDIDIVYAAPTLTGNARESFILDYRPMWRFALEEPSSVTPCIYVDMVTGGLIYDPCNGTLVTDKDKT